MLSYQEVLKIYSDDSFFLYLELSITVLEEKKILCRVKQTPNFTDPAN